MSIRFKLTLWYTGILAVVLLLVGLTIYFLLSYSLLNKQRDELRTFGENVNSTVRVVGFLGVYRIQLPDLDAFQSSGTFLQTMNARNREITSSSNLMGTEMPFSENALQRLEAERDGFFESFNHGDYSFLVFYQPLSYEDSLVGALQVARIVNPTKDFLTNLKVILLLAALLAIALAATIGWFLARKTLQPIETVIQATRRIQNSDDLGMKIDYVGPADEIGRLTDTINGMFTRIRQSYFELAESIHAQRRFVADASHELRTPLTTIRGNVDLLRKMLSHKDEDGQLVTVPETMSEDEREQLLNDALRDISEEAERMSRLVNDMLMLARSDAGVVITREPLDLLPLLEEVVRKAGFFPRRVDWKVGDLSTLAGVTVIGNRDYMQQLFFIFLENAFKYTNEGYVQLDTVRADNQAGIRISDTGIGLDNEQIPLIFERFYRADPSRGLFSGTGLGLSIARWIIDEHQGSIEVESAKGVGTTFTIWLPVYFEDLD